MEYLDSVTPHKLSVHSSTSLDSTAELHKLNKCIRIVTSLLLDVNILQLSQETIAMLLGKRNTLYISIDKILFFILSLFNQLY